MDFGIADLRICLCVLLLATFGQGSNVNAKLGVGTTNGVIVGHLAPHVEGVVEYLGIPYAQPPVGKLRFAAPVPPNQYRAYIAAEWGFDCPQTVAKPVHFPGFTAQAQGIINAFAGGQDTPQSEDCLTLNIWSSSTRPNGKKQPVLVFFHGGRFSIGNAHSSFYNGSRFAEATGAVIVTLTYRLNVFGFPGAPGNTQNLGLRDQRRAVEWLHDNVAGFGGDLSKITIFGQSSGGVAVDWWTFAYKDRPLVNGIISESGNAFSFPLNPMATQTKNWYNVSATLGCGATGDTVDCVRSKNWTDVLAASAKLPATPGGNPVRSTPAFYPTVDNETVFTGYKALFAEGTFANIPQLLGNNNREQGYYIIPAYGRGINTTEAQGQQFLLESFTCANDYEARARTSQGVPVWQYRFFADWNNTRLYPTSGAYHGTELEMLFGNLVDVSGIPPEPAQVQLTKVMQKAWVAFANDPKEGLKKYGWPRFDPAGRTLIRLGYENSAVPSFVLPSAYSAGCGNVTLSGGL
ncbi:hypothetical protein B0A48_11615 [Cryoendolithus antarcticus]|uniref:Carboxylic ester hydrolase n=1 Tax=Cryoendolithus antarcticus TaxID=1507870 RepID=A0A1V8SW03_9PEZI|nr:hypothetical protein B0A48_11615 [Cryoendolithus antarcticus]